MKRAGLIVLAVTLLWGTAYGGFGDLVASFPNQPASGTSTHYGLAADANYLYSYYYRSPYYLYRMRRSNGALVSSYRNPLGTTSPAYYFRGVSYDGTGHLLWLNYSARRVVRARASTGSMVSSWSWPTGSRYGVCANHTGTSGGNRIYTNYYTGDFWNHTTTGSLVSSWSLAFYSYNYDMAWDWNNRVIWAINYNNEWVYGIDPTSQRLLHSFRHPLYASISGCYGIAYWPPYVYISNSGGTPDEYIWVFDVPNNVTINAASMGRVKALFR
ncbi:MAG: hypothetical protein JSU81_06640 [Candidatus Coatesbacteria bacterium]|nr:MAG: hypothetical protein JSU81_06640 [Candidatus Coatesbacteria bacterium]